MYDHHINLYNRHFDRPRAVSEIKKNYDSTVTTTGRCNLKINNDRSLFYSELSTEIKKNDDRTATITVRCNSNHIVIFSRSAAPAAPAFTLIFNFYYNLAYRLSIVKKKKQYGKNTVLYEKCPDDSHESYENVWHC